MNKYIVTTTIHKPTDALLAYASMKDWTLIIVGDLKTPHIEYDGGNWVYLHPDYQKDVYPELSEAIGWNCIMRRNIGFIEAYKRGAEIVASIDDDNIPYDFWGKELLIGKEIYVDTYIGTPYIFDPMQLTNHSELWHRGIPLVFAKEVSTRYVGKKKKLVKIQVDLWDGDPDIDATCRLMYKPKQLKLDIQRPFTSLNYATFNSQNTFVTRDVLPYYMMLPHIGRSDDIWGGFICQYLTETTPVFCKPSVYHDRNYQPEEKNYMDEIFGHFNTNTLLLDIKNYTKHIPENTLKAFELYRKEYES